MSFFQGAKQVWATNTTSGVLAGGTLSVGFIELFNSDYGWGVVNLLCGLVLFAVAAYREIHRG